MSPPWRAVLWRYRIVLAALCLGWAAWIVVTELRPAPPATTTVVVAASDLPAGTMLTEENLALREFTEAPSAVISYQDVVGSVLAVGVPEGLPVVASLLVGPGLVAAAPPGTVVTPVRLADPALAQMIRVGDVIDLYLAPIDTGGRVLEAQLVTSGALVMSRVETPSQDSFMFGGAAESPREESGVVVLAINAEDATLLSGASSLAPFRAVLVAP